MLVRAHPLDVAGERQVVEAIEHLVEHHRDLDAGQTGAEAEVGAVAEGQVRVRVTADVEGEGVGEGLGEGLGVGLALGDGEALGLGDGEATGVEAGDGLAEGVGDGAGVATSLPLGAGAVVVSLPPPPQAATAAHSAVNVAMRVVRTSPVLGIIRSVLFETACDHEGSCSISRQLD